MNRGIFEQLMKDESFRIKLMRELAANGANGARELFKRHGLELTSKEARALYDSVSDALPGRSPDGELDESSLERVAGGVLLPDGFWGDQEAVDRFFEHNSLYMFGGKRRIHAD